MSGRIKERIAQIPQFKSLVGEVLVLYLLQAHLAHAIQVHFELLTSNQIKVAVDVDRETVVLMDIVQNGEEDDKQLFIEVDLSFLVDWTQIHSIAILDDGRCCGYSAVPVYLVESSMNIAKDIEEEILVVLVELHQRQKDVEEGIAQMLPSLANLGYLLVIDNACLVSLVVMEYYYSTIYPYGKLIDEILLLLSQGIVGIEIDNLLRSILAKDKFLAIHILQEHLWKDKHAVTNILVGIVEIADIVHTDVAFDILKSINTLENFLYVCCCIFMFFYDDSHN